MATVCQHQHRAPSGNNPIHDHDVYQRLRRLARFLMRSQSPAHTLQPTALVNESLLRIARSGTADHLTEEKFVALASTTMRRVLINHARDRSAQKRRHDGAYAQRDAVGGQNEALNALLDLDQAMRRLADVAPRQAAVAELHYFGGHATRDIARLLDISPRSVQLDLRTAQSYLRRALSEDEPAHAETR